jgi:hypothetical protein
MYFSFKIKVPKIIENILIFLLVKYRKRKYGYGFMRIKLSKSENVEAKYRYAIIDPEDYEKIAIDDWQLYNNHNYKYYAVRLEDCKVVFMHRQIMGPFDCAQGKSGKVVDHRNREGLDNRKSNLRLATRSQNNCNRKQKKGTSKYRGVCYNKRTKKWRAYISFNGIYKSLGYFENEEEAGRAYDEAAKELHGEFASLNFSEENTEMKKILISNIYPPSPKATDGQES